MTRHSPRCLCEVSKLSLDTYTAEAWVNIRQRYVQDARVTSVVTFPLPDRVWKNSNTQDQWHHVAYVYDNGKESVLVDGIKNKLISFEGKDYRIRAEHHPQVLRLVAYPENIQYMDKVKDFESYRNQLREPCDKCHHEVIAELVFDPYVQKTMANLRTARQGMIALHAHQGKYEQNFNTQIRFLTVYKDKQNYYRLLYTIGGPTFDEAVRKAWLFFEQRPL